MIKHQILIVFLCIVVVVWVAFRLREHKRSKERQEHEDSNDSHNETM